MNSNLKKIAAVLLSGAALTTSAALNADDPKKPPVFLEENQKQIEQVRYAELDEVELFRVLASEALESGLVEFSPEKSLMYSLVEGVEKLKSEKNLNIKGEEFTPEEIESLKNNFLQKFEKVE